MGIDDLLEHDAQVRLAEGQDAIDPGEAFRRRHGFFYRKSSILAMSKAQTKTVPRNARGSRFFL